MRRRILRLTGPVRIGCVTDLEFEMKRLRGILRLDVDLPGRRVEVTYQPGRITPGEIDLAVRLAGFAPQPLEA